MPSKEQLQNFKKMVRTWHCANGRHNLPWRSPTLSLRKDGSVDPYKVLVSEIMLQQTQVDRVIPFYRNFLKRFPTVHALADASLKDVLTHWQGLGYNRRGKLLHECAKAVVQNHNGRIPRERNLLLALPGVGPYIAGAVRAFAFNEADVFIETNIRTVYTHHFLNDKPQVSDREVLPLIEATLGIKNPREWYSALMDYGSFLKRSGIKINAKNPAYKKQSKFEGSDRQIRGAIIRTLSTAEEMTLARIKKINPTFDTNRLLVQVQKLEREGLIEYKKGRWRIA